MTKRKKKLLTTIDKHTHKNKMTLHKTKEKKGLHIKVQEVCKAVYEPHRDKQNKQRNE